MKSHRNGGPSHWALAIFYDLGASIIGQGTEGTPMGSIV